MEFTNLIFLAVFSIAFVSFHISPTNADAVEDDQFLKEHNKYREMDRLPPLVWEKTVADYAGKHAKSKTGTCHMAHSNGQYGENLAAGSANMTPADAVKMWMDEKQDYNLAANTCAQGKMCGSYTQVVWKATTKLGCAKAACQNRSTIIVCSYDPPGNFVGKRPF